MGRTKRKRTRKRIQIDSINIDNDKSIIHLKKWMRQHSFVDYHNLQLRTFPLTGRGITSTKAIKANDILLRVPLNLLITFDTIVQNGLLEYFHKTVNVSMHSILSLFLIMEKHKGINSLWKYYIESLPDPEPQLPWMCTDKLLLEYYPDYLRSISHNLQRMLLFSFNNLKRSIDPNALCSCGCKRPVVCVIEVNLFKWAYVLVNTRAVYINPCFISTSKALSHSILSDEPCIALCPYLDMFNHHYKARTEAKVIIEGNQLFYELKTLVGFKKFAQFFISYGAHDNIKLFLEYGFFVPNNEHDSVDISLEILLKVLNIKLLTKQYKFIAEHRLKEKNVHVCCRGPSYNLKAILFICFYPSEIRNYSEVIYGENYPEDFLLKLNNAVRKLLEFKLGEFSNDVLKLRHCEKQTTNETLKLLNDFLDYRIKYVKGLLENYSLK